MAEFGNETDGYNLCLLAWDVRLPVCGQKEEIKLAESL